MVSTKINKRAFVQCAPSFSRKFKIRQNCKFVFKNKQLKIALWTTTLRLKNYTFCNRDATYNFTIKVQLYNY